MVHNLWTEEYIAGCQLTITNLDDLELFHNHCHYYLPVLECFSKASIDSNLDTLIHHQPFEKFPQFLIHLVAYIWFQFVLNKFRYIAKNKNKLI